jgi:uncharacterized protein (DUF362 family)
VNQRGAWLLGCSPEVNPYGQKKFLAGCTRLYKNVHRSENKKGKMSMSKMSRRDFLRTIAAGMGAVTLGRFLAACSPPPAKPAATPLHPLATVTPSSPTKGSPSAAETSSVQAPSASPERAQTVASVPDMVVVRNGESEALVRAALAALGGMELFVPKGANVVVKPNICVAYHTYEYAATTNPWVVGTLVKMCFEAGAAAVRVYDYPFGGTPQEAYAISGIKDQVEANGGEMVYMPGFKYVSTQVPNGLELKKTDVFSDILNADVIIDVPIAKHHSSAGLTLGMKNLMGVVRDRSAFHRNLGQRIADLSTLLKPKLTVVDAVRILMANGPTGGNLDDVKKLDTVIASADIVAADSYATTLFGKQPEDIAYIKAATAMGLGRSDLTNLRIQELSVGT